MINLIVQKTDIFPNLIWLRFPRLLDTALRHGSGPEGLWVIAKLVRANRGILQISASQRKTCND